MNRTGLVIRWQWVLATLLVGVLMLVTGALMAPASEAASASNCSYYNNAQHSTLVGRFGRDCCNNTVAWGTKSQFSECSSGCLLCVPPAP